MQSRKKIALWLIAMTSNSAVTIFFFFPSNSACPGTQIKHVVIVSSFDDFPDEKNTTTFLAQALQEYWWYRNQGLGDDNITMMAVVNNYKYVDYDYNGMNDLDKCKLDYIDGNVTKVQFVKTLNCLAKSVTKESEIVISLIGQGESGATSGHDFSDGILTPAMLESALNEISCKKMTILIDCCFSGIFIEPLKASNRIIITSTNTKSQAWYYWNWGEYLTTSDLDTFGNSGSVFFHPFWSEIAKNFSIVELTSALSWISQDGLPLTPIVMNSLQQWHRKFGLALTLSIALVFSINRTMSILRKDNFNDACECWSSKSLVSSHDAHCYFQDN
ncbi:MAG TPA: C13 family peptidase [Candidatus Lokiarchaeia archaeon]|nr:C13 family peptidase [Candidatus Lokiarchaeia archaeon]